MTRANPLIVISDEEEFVVDLYEKILSGRGLTRCISVSDKDSLLHLTSAIKPDLVITNIGLSQMNGLKFLEALAQRDEVGIIPVIVASTEQRYARDALALGAIRFIIKPFGVQEFVEAVTSALAYSPWTEDSA